MGGGLSRCSKNQNFLLLIQEVKKVLLVVFATRKSPFPQIVCVDGGLSRWTKIQNCLLFIQGVKQSFLEICVS